MGAAASVRATALELFYDALLRCLSAMLEDMLVCVCVHVCGVFLFHPTFAQLTAHMRAATFCAQSPLH